MKITIREKNILVHKYMQCILWKEFCRESAKIEYKRINQIEIFTYCLFFWNIKKTSDLIIFLIFGQSQV